MLTLASQCAITLFRFAIGILALRIARGTASDQVVYRYGWALTGAAFLLHATNKAFHDVFAVIAFVGGPSSGTWARYLAWNAPLNHSRTFLLTAYGLLLAYAIGRYGVRREMPTVRVWGPLFLTAMALGIAAGVREDVFSPLRHYTAVAVWDIMELLSMMVLLLVGLGTGRMDRGLWACLSVNAFVLALSVLWFAALSRLGLGAEWAPRPFQIQITKAGLYAVMIVIAHRQLGRVRNGERLQGFFEPRKSQLASLHG